MKKLIPFLLIVSACSTVQTEKLPEKGWVNVVDQGGRAAASVNQFTGETLFYQAPEKAFEALYLGYVAMVQSCQQKPTAQPPKAPEVPKGAKLSPKKAEVKDANPGAKAN